MTDPMVPLVCECGHRQGFHLGDGWCTVSTCVCTSFRRTDNRSRFPEGWDRDESKAGAIFEDHSCYRCDSGNKPCIKGKGRERDCDTLHARND